MAHGPPRAPCLTQRKRPLPLAPEHAPMTRILLIQGHPDPDTARLGRRLEDAYAQGADAAGHELRRIDLATLDFPLLHSQAEWRGATLPAALVPAQEAIAWAQHIVIFFPLWLGGMPALLKGFLEQVARPGFAIGEPDATHPYGRKLLGGRSARVVVTMGMPALAYRWYFRAHSLKALERNILGFVGIAPVHETLVGLVDRLGAEGVQRWAGKLHALGRRGA